MWYRLDEGDSDLSTFYYPGLAAKKGRAAMQKTDSLIAH